MITCIHVLQQIKYAFGMRDNFVRFYTKLVVTLNLSDVSFCVTLIVQDKSINGCVCVNSPF